MIEIFGILVLNAIWVLAILFGILVICVAFSWIQAIIKMIIKIIMKIRNKLIS